MFQKSIDKCKIATCSISLAVAFRLQACPCRSSQRWPKLTFLSLISEIFVSAVCVGWKSTQRTAVSCLKASILGDLVHSRFTCFVFCMCLLTEKKKTRWQIQIPEANTNTGWKTQILTENKNTGWQMQKLVELANQLPAPLLQAAWVGF